MTTLCPTKVNSCLPCNDSPIENLSGEGPDNPSFLGIYRPPYTPRLSIPFESLGCVRWCFSEVSQAEADLCAQHQAEECQSEDVFYSASKTCEIICPSGGGVSETVEPGTVISSISQADADARAEAVACRKASLNACSFVVLPIPNQAQGVSCIEGEDLLAHVELPSNLSISGPTLTVAAGSFSASTQEEANALAAAYVSDYMNAGIASGDLECGGQWVFDPSTNCAAVTGIPSFVTTDQLSMECNPPAGSCPIGTVCSGAIPLTVYQWDVTASHSIGPYSEDKDIVLTGTYSALRELVLGPCATASRGFCTIDVRFVGGVINYSGDFTVAPAGVDNGSFGPFVITGTLPAGQVTSVTMFASQFSRSSNQLVNCIFDVEVDDVP